jgi:hypothetical protein
MITGSIREEIIQQLDRLSPEQQRQVLDFARGLARPRGESGREFIEKTRHIQISPEDLQAMQDAIEEECERIDWGEWDLPA